MPTVIIHVIKFENAEPLQGAEVTLDSAAKKTDSNGTVQFINIPYNSPTLTITHKEYITYSELLGATQPKIELTIPMKLKETPPEKVAFTSEVATWGSKVIDSLQIFGKAVQDGLWGRIDGVITAFRQLILERFISAEIEIIWAIGTQIESIPQSVANLFLSTLEAEIEKDKREHPEAYAE